MREIFMGINVNFRCIFCHILLAKGNAYMHIATNKDRETLVNKMYLFVQRTVV